MLPLPPAGNAQALEEGWKGLLIRLREASLLEKPPLARAGTQEQPSCPREVPAEPVSKGRDNIPCLVMRRASRWLGESLRRFLRGE